MINDYSTLQAKVAQWLARSDLASVIPDFIQLAESRMNLDLGMSDQQVQVTGTSVGGVITPPTDFRQVQALTITVDGIEREIYPFPPTQGTNADLYPRVIGYNYIGGLIYLIGAQDSAYRMVYYASIPSLSASQPQNWLIQQYPQMYLYATLLEASVYLRDDQRTSLFGTGYQNALSELRSQDDMTRYGPSPRPRVDFITA